MFFHWLLKAFQEEKSYLSIKDEPDLHEKYVFRLCELVDDKSNHYVFVGSVFLFLFFNRMLDIQVIPLYPG